MFYLSPHADDVALSCGGSVALDVRSGQEVTLVTVFSGSEAGRHAQARARAQRRTEDRAAAAALGCDLLELGLPDALDRPEVRGRLDLFDPLGQRHLWILCEVVSRLRAAIPKGAVVIAPLGVGGHIDHRLLQAAARAVTEERRQPLHLYEDQPYSLAPFAVARRMAGLGAGFIEADSQKDAPWRKRGTVQEEILAQRAHWASQPLGRKLGLPGLRWLTLYLGARVAVEADRPGHQPGFPLTLRKVVRDVTDGAAARFAAIAAYSSQWPLLFASLDQMQQALKDYGQALAQTPPTGPDRQRLYERLWLEVLPD